MNVVRALARIPSGRRTKWLVLVFWLLVVAALGPLAGKLTNAEKNDASAWLPAQAESTKVVNLQATFQSPNLFTGVVVYSRPSGLTAADRAKAGARGTTMVVPIALLAVGLLTLLIFPILYRTFLIH